MKVLIAASEIAPLAKTGGLADVIGALPVQLKKQGVEVALVMPKYRNVSLSGEVVGDLELPIEDTLMEGAIEKVLLSETDIPVFLIQQVHYYDRDELYTTGGKDYSDNLERYTFFCRAVLDIVRQGFWKPDLIHANDWQTALIPILIKTSTDLDSSLSSLKTLFTIHNLFFQGLFPAFLYSVLGIPWKHFNLSELEYYNHINLMKGGILYSDSVSTVSKQYAKEIQTEAFGCGLEGVLKEASHRLTGIINSPDYSEWSPEIDPYIPRKYTVDRVEEGKAENKRALLDEFGLPSASESRPLFGVVSRLASQKGLDLLAEIAPLLIEEGAQIIVLGMGELELEKAFKDLHRQFPNDCGVNIAYDNSIAHLIEAGSDIFLMPSRFEPCGMNQMYSLRYGTIPIVRATGGLADTVTDVGQSPQGNGFVFEKASPDELFDTCLRAMKLYRNRKAWLDLVRRAMNVEFSWERSAIEYIQLYTSILNE